MVWLLAAGIHLVLLFIFFFVPRGSPAQQPAGRRQAIQFLVLTPAAPRAQAPPRPRPMARQGSRPALLAVDRSMPARSAVIAVRASGAIATAPAVPAAERAPQVDELAPIPATPLPRSADEIMRLAKRDIAGIAHEMNKDLAGRDKALSSDLQNRLDRRFAEAHAAARPEWYQAAKVEEVTTAANGSARVYRITTAIGTFCVTYPKNGGRPTYATCG